MKETIDIKKELIALSSNDKELTEIIPKVLSIDPDNSVQWKKKFGELMKQYIKKEENENNSDTLL